MSVVRIDVDKCIGCGICIDVCPMDVFYYSFEDKKSVIAYPECCQTCGQCYVNCPTGSIGISNDMFGYAFTAVRGIQSAPMNHVVMTEPGVYKELYNGLL